MTMTCSSPSPGTSRTAALRAGTSARAATGDPAGRTGNGATLDPAGAEGTVALWDAMAGTPQDHHRRLLLAATRGGAVRALDPAGR